MWFIFAAFFRNETMNTRYRYKNESRSYRAFRGYNSLSPLGSVSHLPLLGLLVDNLYQLMVPDGVPFTLFSFHFLSNHHQYSLHQLLYNSPKDHPSS